jgi:SAM-dependent methyltransferase
VSDYTFGDTDLAAERLHILDTTFSATTVALLGELAVTPARVADLGCGPGATTARLARRFPDATVVGIEASAAFAARARAAVPSARFEIADVTAPLPGAPYDLIYARFLLAHLPDVSGALRVWADALASDGLLVLEETGTITSVDADFARYEELTRARVATTGASVYAGSLIVPNLPLDAVAVTSESVIRLDLTAGQAAAMFWRNLETWGPAAVADGHLTDAEHATLLARLRARENDTTRRLFTWTHHQVVARRYAPPPRPPSSNPST